MWIVYDEPEIHLGVPELVANRPGLDLALVHRLGLRHDVERTCIGFMGCFAALNGLKTARHIARSEPGARVLVVCVELYTLHFQDTPELEKVLSLSLFGDGAAAALVAGDGPGLDRDSFETIVVADEPSLITWTVRDQGFDMVLSGKVPGAVRDFAVVRRRARTRHRALGRIT